MNPKCIIIKTQSNELFNALIYKLKELKSIRFFYKKINCFYTIIIKCHNYYNPHSKLEKNKLYGSYIFLYSIISIILAELFILYYENTISKRIIFFKKNKNINLDKLSCITSLLLDKNSPFDFSKELFYTRKKILIDTLLENFRKCNFLYTDFFIDFFAKNYITELEAIINTSLIILKNDILYNYMMQFIFAKNDNS